VAQDSETTTEKREADWQMVFRTVYPSPIHPRFVIPIRRKPNQNVIANRISENYPFAIAISIGSKPARTPLALSLGLQGFR
jgi:hypothetical protein